MHGLKVEDHELKMFSHSVISNMKEFIAGVILLDYLSVSLTFSVSVLKLKACSCQLNINNKVVIHFQKGTYSSKERAQVSVFSTCMFFFLTADLYCSNLHKHCLNLSVKDERSARPTTVHHP